jgi:hypothetical protein
MKPLRCLLFRAGAAALLATLSLLLASSHAQDVQSPSYDLVIRAGNIVDGTGNPWFTGDVAVNGDRIAAWSLHRVSLPCTRIRISRSLKTATPKARSAKA